MSLIILFTIIFIVIWTIYAIKKRNVKSKKSEKGYEIIGAVYSKIQNKGLVGVHVKLGFLNAKSGNHNFKIEKEVKTDKNGKFVFSDIKKQSYWLMAEYKGKKVLKKVEFYEGSIIEDALLVF